MTSLIGVLIASGSCYLVARFLNKRIVAAGSKPFTWGYYQSCMLLVGAVGVLVYYVDYTQNTYYSGSGDFVALLVVEALLVGSSVLNLRRYRLGAIAVTVLNLNPVSWGINWVYYRNRWSELKTIRKPSIPHPHVNRHHAGHLSPPSYLHGTWFNDDLTVQIDANGLSVFRHRDGPMIIPPKVAETSSGQCYSLNYRDPFVLSDVEIRFTLEDPTVLRFMILRNGTNTETAEQLQKTPTDGPP